MPGAAPHPQFNVLAYRTPRGMRAQRDLGMLDPAENTVGYAWISELVMGTTHTGTHIDALCHITCGPESTWHGGHSADELLGDFGPLSHDASTLPPLIARGVLLDIPALLGVAYLPESCAIGPEELEGACVRQGVEIAADDVVLVRTGVMRDWPAGDSMAAEKDPGVSLAGAQWLSERRPYAVGADTVAFEVEPSGIQGNPQPVHVHLVRDSGILILEWVNCEELARDGVSTFLLLALPLPIRGATGSMIRPIAIV